MKTKAGPGKARGDAASAQIGLGERARHRARQGVELRGGSTGVVRRFNRPVLAKAPDALGLVQEVARFGKGFAAIPQVFVEPDEIEQVAMLSGRAIGPAAGPVAPEFDEQAAAAGAGNVARDPVASVSGVHWEDRPGRPPRPERRGGARVRMRCSWITPRLLAFAGALQSIVRVRRQRRIEHEEPRQRFDAARGLNRQEQPQAPGDNLAEEAEGLELLDFGIAEAGKLDALRAHERRNPKSHPAAKRDGPRLGEKRAMRVLGR